MPTTRRFFLKSGTLAAMAAGIGLASARLGFAQDPVRSFEIPMEAQRDPVYMFRAGTFEPYVNGIFQAPDSQGQMVNLVLQKVTKFSSGKGSKFSPNIRQTEGFSLMFRASRPLPPFTSIHTITHSALGNFDLFLSHRVGADRRNYYEAVINHLI